MDISADVYDYYHVTATDFTGNEGDASTVENTYAGTGRDDSVPETHALMQNRPNPFKAATSIRFDLPQTARVTLKVYDVSGRMVRTLACGMRAEGRHVLMWNGADDAGAKAGSGVYFLRIQAGDYRATRKMILE